MGLKISLNLVKTVFGKNAKKVINEVPQTPLKELNVMTASQQVPLKKLNVMTDPSSGIVRMEREITCDGKEALAILEKSPDGQTKMQIVNSSGGKMFVRTKNIYREKGASVFGGDKVTITKQVTMPGTQNTKLVKEYSPQGVLEHKEFNSIKDRPLGQRSEYRHAVQDRVYNEYPLNSSEKGMLYSPDTNKYIKHEVDGNTNYDNFLDGSETNYTRAVKAQEQAAQKAALELKSKQPRINIAKAFGKNIEDLPVIEKKLPDGTIERNYIDPDTIKLIVKTHDRGALHKEWIYGGKADKIFMKQFDKNTPYIVAKKGNYTQVDYVKRDYNWEMPDGKFYKEYVSEQYYNDGANALKRSTGGNQVYNDATGKVTVYDSTAAKYREKYPSLEKDYPDYPQVSIRNGESACGAYQNNLTNSQIQANRLVKELNKDAQQNAIDLKNLFSDYSL